MGRGPNCGAAADGSIRHTVQDVWPDGSESQFILVPITLSRVMSYTF